MNNQSPLTTQVGGSHYTKLKYQPMEFAMHAELTACQFSVLKYVTRFKDKDGLRDLKKAHQCCDLGLLLDIKVPDDDTHHLQAMLHRYIHDNELDELQDLAISLVVMQKNYTRAKHFIEIMIGEWDDRLATSNAQPSQ